MPDTPTLQPVEQCDRDAAADWTLWSVERPTNLKAMYRWRIPARMILGITLRPEWSGKLSFCGMGYDPGEYWPPFSRWNGYVRSVPDGTEWRLATADEGERDIFWGGLDLLPSPFTGKPPKVDYCPSYIGAPPYEPNWLKIVSYMIGFNSWKDAGAMQRAWNTRLAAQSSPGRERAFEATVNGRVGKRIDSLAELMRLINGGAHLEKIAFAHPSGEGK